MMADCAAHYVSRWKKSSKRASSLRAWHEVHRVPIYAPLRRQEEVQTIPNQTHSKSISVVTKINLRLAEKRANFEADHFVKYSPIIRFSLAVASNVALARIAYLNGRWRSDERAIMLEISGAGIALLTLLFLWPFVLKQEGFVRLFAAICLCIIPLLVLLGIANEHAHLL